MDGLGEKDDAMMEQSRGFRPLAGDFFVSRAYGMGRLLLRLSGFGGQGEVSLFQPLDVAIQFHV